MAENWSTMQIAAIGGATQFRFVTADSGVGNTGQVTDTTAGAVALGVAMNTAAAGAEVSVVVAGFCEVDCAEALVGGDLVASDGTGNAVIAATNDNILGEYAPLPLSGDIPDAVSGDRVRILLYANKMTLAL